MATDIRRATPEEVLELLQAGDALHREAAAIIEALTFNLEDATSRLDKGRQMYGRLHEHYKTLLSLAHQVREAQRRYWRRAGASKATRQALLAHSKGLEERLDRWISEKHNGQRRLFDA